MKVSKKTVCWVILAVFVMSVFMIAGCGGGKKEPAAGGTPKVITMRYGHTMATEHAIHKAAVFFAEKVKEKTQGRVEVKVFPGGQLGGEKAQLEGLWLELTTSFWERKLRCQIGCRSFLRLICHT